MSKQMNNNKIFKLGGKILLEIRKNHPHTSVIIDGNGVTIREDLAFMPSALLDKKRGY